jgi:hypothetical protein
MSFPVKWRPIGVTFNCHNLQSIHFQVIFYLQLGRTSRNEYLAPYTPSPIGSVVPGVKPHVDRDRRVPMRGGKFEEIFWLDSPTSRTSTKPSLAKLRGDAEKLTSHKCESPKSALKDIYGLLDLPGPQGQMRR